jgi:rod shape-determining protein MreC
MIRAARNGWTRWKPFAGLGLSLTFLALVLLRAAWVPIVQDVSQPLLSQLQSVSAGWLALRQEWLLTRQQALRQRAVLRELRQLRQQQQALEIVAAENQRLRQLLNLPVPKAYRKIAAQVIARPPSQWLNRLQIDKGFADGLSLNRVVMNQQGVVGKITELSAHSAMVSLLTDPESAVSCLTEKERRPAILRGGFAGEPAHLTYLENYSRVMPGEKILTSGLGGTFPPDLLLGTVRRSQQKPGQPVPEVEVALAAFVEIIQQVIVLVPET